MNESAPTTTQQSSLYHPVSPYRKRQSSDCMYILFLLLLLATQKLSLSLMITSSSSISPIHQWSKAVSFFFPSGNVVTLYFPKISWAIGLKSQVQLKANRRPPVLLYCRRCSLLIYFFVQFCAVNNFSVRCRKTVILETSCTKLLTLIHLFGLLFKSGVKY